MLRDVSREADGKIKRPRSLLSRKLLYGSVLSAAYAVLFFVSVNYRDFQVFYLVCLCISFLPLFGLLPSLQRTFVLLAVALLVMNLMPADLLQGDYRTLPANMDQRIEVSSENIPGIVGMQRITTDRMGFRTGNRVIQYEAETPYRIFAIGASTTAQGFLDDSRTWTRILESRLNAAVSRPVEVINTGVGGLRLVHHLATQDRIEDLNPDLVVFLIGINDWNRQVRAHFDHDERFRRSLTERLRSRFQRSVAFTFYQMYMVLPQRTPLVFQEPHFTAMTDRKSRPHVLRFLPPAVSEDFAGEMAGLVGRCRAGSYRCMLLTQPNAYYVGAPDAVTRYFRLTPPNRSYTLDLESLVHVAGLYNDYVRNFAAKHAFLMCDLEAIVPKGTEAFYDDVHFNNNGARIVAEAVTGCIIDQVPEL